LPFHSLTDLHTVPVHKSRFVLSDVQCEISCTSQGAVFSAVSRPITLPFTSVVTPSHA